MMYTCVETGKQVKARTYKEAAYKLFGNETYANPANGGNIGTTYLDTHNGLCIVRVYKVGDKQGTFWGVQAATPAKYTLIHD